MKVISFAGALTLASVALAGDAGAPPHRPQCPLPGDPVLGRPRGHLEDQAKLPILNPIAMGMPSPEAVVAKVRGIPSTATPSRSSAAASPPTRRVPPPS